MIIHAPSCYCVFISYFTAECCKACRQVCFALSYGSIANRGSNTSGDRKAQSETKLVQHPVNKSEFQPRQRHNFMLQAASLREQSKSKRLPYRGLSCDSCYCTECKLIIIRKVSLSRSHHVSSSQYSFLSSLVPPLYVLSSYSYIFCLCLTPKRMNSITTAECLDGLLRTWILLYHLLTLCIYVYGWNL